MIRCITMYWLLQNQIVSESSPVLCVCLSLSLISYALVFSTLFSKITNVHIVWFYSSQFTTAHRKGCKLINDKYRWESKPKLSVHQSKTLIIVLHSLDKLFYPLQNSAKKQIYTLISINWHFMILFYFSENFINTV